MYNSNQCHRRTIPFGANHLTSADLGLEPRHQSNRFGLSDLRVLSPVAKSKAQHSQHCMSGRNETGKEVDILPDPVQLAYACCSHEEVDL